MAGKSSIDPHPQKQRVHIVGKLFAARRIVHVSVVFLSVAQVNAAIGGPEVAQEACDTRRWLREDLRRHTLFVRAQPEDAHVIQPRDDGIVLVVSQVLTRGEIDLIPGSFLRDAWYYGLAKDRRCQARYYLCQVVLACCVLDDVPRQRAAVADEMPQ